MLDPDSRLELYASAVLAEAMQFFNHSAEAIVCAHSRRGEEMGKANTLLAVTTLAQAAHPIDVEVLSTFAGVAAHLGTDGIRLPAVRCALLGG